MHQSEENNHVSAIKNKQEMRLRCKLKEVRRKVVEYKKIMQGNKRNGRNRMKEKSEER